ncbi:MAG: DUF167 domain-containing protein [Pyrinomonadaceae bacterium]|nr:DUF167 domain-containing protein [Pyrinomonadaceae bacterium]
MINFSKKNGALIFSVRVTPRASKSEIVGEHAGALKVRLSSPPVKGAANKELIKLLSKKLAVSKSDVKIAGGAGSKIKKVLVVGVDSGVLRQFETR